MERMEKKANLNYIYLILILNFLLSLTYSLTCEKCKVSVIEIKGVSREGTKININGSLWYFEIPSGKSTEEMIEKIQKSIYTQKDIEKFTEVNPVENAEINISFVSNKRVVLLCVAKTNSLGNFNCDNIDISQLAGEGCARIVVEFGGKDDLPQASKDIPFCVPFGIPFGSILDEKCIAVVLILGVLIAAAYAAGFDPTKAFDITIPKLKGLKGYPGYKYKKINIKAREAALKLHEKINIAKLKRIGRKIGINLPEIQKEKIPYSSVIGTVSQIKRRVIPLDERLRRIEKEKRLAKSEETKRKLEEEEKEILKKKKLYEKFIETYKRAVANSLGESIFGIDEKNSWKVYQEVIKARQRILDMVSKRKSPKEIEKEIEKILNGIQPPNSLYRPIIEGLIACYNAKYGLIGRAIEKIHKMYIDKRLPPELSNKYLEAIKPGRKVSEEERIDEILKIYSKIDPEDTRRIIARLDDVNKDIYKLEDHLGVRNITNSIPDKIKAWREKTLDEIKRMGGSDIGDINVLDLTRRRYLIEETTKCILDTWEDALTITAKRTILNLERKERKFSEVGTRVVANVLSDITSEYEGKRMCVSVIREIAGGEEGTEIWDKDYVTAVQLTKNKVLTKMYDIKGNVAEKLLDIYLEKKEVDDILFGINLSINKNLEKENLWIVSQAFNKDFENFEEAREEFMKLMNEMIEEKDSVSYNMKRKNLVKILKNLLGEE